MKDGISKLGGTEFVYSETSIMQTALLNEIYKHDLIV